MKSVNYKDCLDVLVHKFLEYESKYKDKMSEITKKGFHSQKCIISSVIRNIVPNDILTFIDRNDLNNIPIPYNENVKQENLQIFSTTKSNLILISEVRFDIIYTP